MCRHEANHTRAEQANGPHFRQPASELSPEFLELDRWISLIFFGRNVECDLVLHLDLPRSQVQIDGVVFYHVIDPMTVAFRVNNYYSGASLSFLI